ncbi:MAG TPA: universal stress protein [Nitrososphaeraceae archaeon]|nr:universal stress protein [Nitrososphaeraceae archaeon]
MHNVIINESLSAIEFEDLRDEIINSRDKKHIQEKIYQLYARGPLAIKYLREVKDILKEDNGVVDSCNEFIKKLESSSKKFNKILVSIDGSKESFDAADYGINLAKLSNALMIVMHVLPQEIRYAYEDIDAIKPNISATPVKGIVELSKQEVQAKWFNKILEKAKKSDVNIQTDIIVATKSVSSEIVDYADKFNVDLIIVGTRGRSGLKRILLGSVASEVVKYADCAVLITK